jgi:hypothetical protein
MKRRIALPLLLSLTPMALAVAWPPHQARAQEIDFGQIRAFESMGTGTVHGGGPAKTVVDDDQGHAVVLTIWNSDTDAKVYWKPANGGEAQTTVIHGTGVRAFQTDGLFKIEAVGASDRRIEYDYVLFRLTKG